MAHAYLKIYNAEAHESLKQAEDAGEDYCISLSYSSDELTRRSPEVAAVNDGIEMSQRLYRQAAGKLQVFLFFQPPSGHRMMLDSWLI